MNNIVDCFVNIELPDSILLFNFNFGTICNSILLFNPIPVKKVYNSLNTISTYCCPKETSKNYPLKVKTAQTGTILYFYTLANNKNR